MQGLQIGDTRARRWCASCFLHDMDEALLSVRDLTVAFETRLGSFDAVRGVSFDVKAGKTLGVVGESGSGKSVTAMALMQLLPETATVKTGEVVFAGRDPAALGDRAQMNVPGRLHSMLCDIPHTLP